MMIKSSVGANLAGYQIKEMPEAELKKHKVGDIPGFIKAGNISMVHGLVQYYGLGQSLLLLKGIQEEFLL